MPAATASGLPPKVEPCEPGAMPLAASALASIAQANGARVKVIAGDGARFSVTDTGYGIPPEHLPRIVGARAHKPLRAWHPAIAQNRAIPVVERQLRIP